MGTTSCVEASAEISAAKAADSLGFRPSVWWCSINRGPAGTNVTKRGSPRLLSPTALTAALLTAAPGESAHA
jgi:hypothetical protein